MQSMRKPKYFWVSAGAPRVSVIISTILLFALKGRHHGINVVSLSAPITTLALDSLTIISAARDDISAYLLNKCTA